MDSIMANQNVGCIGGQSESRMCPFYYAYRLGENARATHRGCDLIGQNFRTCHVCTSISVSRSSAVLGLLGKMAVLRHGCSMFFDSQQVLVASISSFIN